MERVRNSASVLQCHSGVPLNDQEGKSPIPFCSPQMCRGVSGEACRVLSRSDNAMGRGPATFDDRVTICDTHDNAARLSQYSPTCLWRRHGATSSITSQYSRRPAISRSEFVIGPSGLSSVHTRSWTSCSYSRRKTVEMHSSFSPTTTLPFLPLQHPQCLQNVDLH